MTKQIDAEGYMKDDVLKELRESRGYNYEDLITVNKDSMANYDEKVLIVV